MSNSIEISWPRSCSSRPQALGQAVEGVGQEQDAHRRPSANARQLVARQPVDDALAAEGRGHLHEMVVVGDAPRR
jgi:hypothetical protein